MEDQELRNRIMLAITPHVAGLLPYYRQEAIVEDVAALIRKIEQEKK